ncbi:dixin-A isoform X4 [Phycodurus eques]|nr:dixin-A isoform X4 [Phycodurus eques]
MMVVALKHVGTASTLTQGGVKDVREDICEFSCTVPQNMTSLSSASPVRSPKEEYAVTRSSDTLGDETIRDQPKEQRGGPCNTESELTDKNLAEEMSLCGLCPSLGHDVPEEDKSWEEQLDVHQEQLEKEMHEARRMVFRLQALLLNGSLPEDDHGGSVSFGDNRANGEQQLVLTRSRLDQSMEEALDLKRELLRHKQDVRHIQAIKDALQQRLSVQEDAVLQLKQELLRSNMAKDQLEGENAVLKDNLSERNKLLGEYEQQLGRKDRMLQQLKQDEAQHKAHDVGHHRSFRSEGGYSSSPLAFQHSAPSEELQLVREALRSLRDNFSGHDPQHHTLDTLEQGVSSLMDRLHLSDTQRQQNRGEEFKSPGRRANSSDRDSWPQTSKMAHSHSSPGLDAAVSTKVLYFTDRSLTPFLINIPKRLGEVTLRDFKAAVDRQGSFRYHFKALDPEFGTVKEEVFQDGAVVPGWEGKIVAWVEEDHGERR